MKTALGKGLDALIPKRQEEILQIEVERIVAGPEQPRRTFNEDSLNELAFSIKEKGVIQPVIVRRDDNGFFTLIAGERRLRASRIAGLKRIPAIVRVATHEDALEIALIENIQREDLNPIETAAGFERLMTEFNLTQERLAEKVGKERATVANYLRLLRLPEDVKKAISDGKLSMGHARAILGMEEPRLQSQTAFTVIEKGLNVRETEELVKKLQSAKQSKEKSKPKGDSQIASLEERLIKHLATKVKISHKGKKGKIEIEYYSLEEFDRLLEILLG